MDEWPQVYLPEVCRFQEGPGVLAKDFCDHGIPLIRLSGLGGHEVSLTGCNYVSEEKGAGKWGHFRLDEGDILISTSASLGRPAVVGGEAAGAIFYTGIIRFRSKSKRLNEGYLKLFLGSRPFMLQAEAMATGSVIKHYGPSHLKSMWISLPPIGVQEDIVGLIAPIDDKIELNRRMNETLEAQARALFRDWFVDFGPVKAKMAGAPPYFAAKLWSLFPDRLNDVGVPEGWSPATLDTFATCRNRKANPEEVDDGTAYIGLEHMPRRSIALSEWEGAEKVTSAKSRFQRRDILFGKLRPYFHKVGIAPVDGICSTDIVVLAPRKKRFEALTLACVSTDEFVAFTDQSSTGTKMPRTSWKTMRTYPIVMPSDKIADAFQSVCEPMIDRILANIEENQTLVQTRDLLLPKLMSGEIRVRESA